MSYSKGGIIVRNLHLADAKSIFEWQNADGSRKYCRNKGEIDIGTHMNWVAKRILAGEKRECITQVVEYCGYPVAMVRLDPILEVDPPDHYPVYEVSVIVDPKHRRGGFGKIAINSIWGKGRNGQVIAFIDEKNTGSIALFKSCGYNEGGNDKIISYIKERV